MEVRHRLIVVFELACLLFAASALSAQTEQWHWTLPTLSTALQGPKVEVRWTQPVRRASASDEAKLAYYRVHFGPVSQGQVHDPSAFQYPSSLQVTADQFAVILDGLPPGKPYFVAVTALDTEGRESPYSIEHRLTVAPQKPPAKRASAAPKASVPKAVRRPRRKAKSKTARAQVSTPSKPVVRVTKTPDKGARTVGVLRDPASVSTSPPPGPSDRRGSYTFKTRPEDDGFMFVGAGDYRAVRDAVIDGDWFEDRAGSVFHVTWLPSRVTIDQEIAYVEQSLWHAWRDVHPSLHVYLVRGQVNPALIPTHKAVASFVPYTAQVTGANPTLIPAHETVGHFIPYTAHVTGEKRSIEYAIRLAIFRGTDQTYACILSTPIGGSMFDRKQKRLLKQRQQQADAFFKIAMQSFRSGLIEQDVARTALHQDHAVVQALMGAAEKGDTDGIRTLLGQGVDANMRGRLSKTPLMVAAGYGHTETVRVLLQAGAQVGTQTQWGATALIAAALNGHATVVRELEAEGATLLPLDKSGAE